MSRSASMALRIVAVFLVCLVQGCATLQQYAALQNVDFAWGGLSRVHLAGVDLAAIRSFDDLGLVDGARLLQAAAAGDLPLDLRVDVQAENPADNGTEARLMRLDWTLFLEERETLSGVLDEEVVLPPGQPRTIPVDVSLNLVEFFEGSAQDLIELGLSLAGQGGAGKNVALRIWPVIETPLGAMRYPQPITLVDERVGR
jgi:hypothetical protein